MKKKQWWKQMQPLRIPSYWSIGYNKLEDLEPSELSTEDRAWLFVFVQDILYVYRKYTNKHIEHTITVDLGWYPDGDPKGSFHLIALLDSDWKNPILEFSSRSKAEIVETLESWLFYDLAYYKF